ncbi:MAG: HAD family hydrolase, partial [Ktedonobacterales bacterium]
MRYGRYRLIATDLDGTLLCDDRTVSQRTRIALAAAQTAGITIVLVTGRPPRVAREIAALLATGTMVDTSDTFHAHPAHELAICCNGALVYDLT